MKITTRPLPLLTCACIGTLGVMALAYAPQKSIRNSAYSTMCLSNLKQLGLATMLYIQDYHETYPPLSSMARYKKVVLPYTKNEEFFTTDRDLFTCPAIKKPYVVNYKFVDKRAPVQIRDFFPQAGIMTPSKTVLLYDRSSHADKTWGVTYTDGHTKREKKLPPLGMR